MPKRCQFENCIKQAIGKTDFCKRHGGGKRCQYEGCNVSAVGKTDFCVAHGGGKRCPGCIDWLDSQSGCKKYDGYCARCFKRTFPEDKRSSKIYEKTYEIKVRNFLNENYEGFIHDIPLWTGNCERVHRKMINNTILAIETDERQHSSYNSNDEEIKYDDLYMIYSGKWIFIRINPDGSYIDSKNIIKKPSLKVRLNRLKRDIDKQIERIEKEKNENLVEIIKLYYNEI